METPMTVSEFEPRESTKNNTSYRRERGFAREMSIIDPKTGDAVVTARFYWPGDVAYCCVWVHGWAVGKPSGQGYGKAGGYGYHKESAALESALRDAGITFSQGIAGRGDSAMRAAFQALAACLEIVNPIFHEAHP